MNLSGNISRYASIWPSGLRRGSAASRLRVRIPPGAWLCVYFECCVFSGRGLRDGPIPSLEQSCRLWCVVVCDLGISRRRRPWPALGCCGQRKKIVFMCSVKGGSLSARRILCSWMSHLAAVSSHEIY